MLWLLEGGNEMTNAKAFAPAHLTGFFKIYSNGSTGAGVNLDEGVTTRVTVRDGRGTNIFINGEKANAPASLNVVKTYKKHIPENVKISVRHKSPLPAGYGLGLSGAGAYSLSIALNEALEMDLTDRVIRKVAQDAEIKAGTGLGDVVAQQYSGLMVGKKPYPSQSVIRIPIKEKYVVLGFFDEIDTGTIIRNASWKKKINEVGGRCMEEFMKKKTVSNFMYLSRYFTNQIGLANEKLREMLDLMPHTAQVMLGQTIFTITDNPRNDRREFSRYTLRVRVCKVAEKGAHLI